jgi:DNA-binding NarL/FixJ family response regulator
MNVFIVDDATIVVEKLTAMFSGIDGVECVGHAKNALDAIRSIAEMKPDVVILDIHLKGGGNGMDVLAQIKKQNLPPIVIMLTNYHYPQYRKKCETLGADYFLDKVTDIEKLYNIFDQLMIVKTNGVLR